MGRKLLALIEVIQAVVTLLLGGISFYLLALTRHSDDPDVRAGLRIVAAMVLALALPVGISCCGLVKRKKWGWWLALAIDVLGLVLFLWDPVADRSWPDPDEAALIFLFAVPAALLLLDPVRRQFAGNAKAVNDSGNINS